VQRPAEEDLPAVQNRQNYMRDKIPTRWSHAVAREVQNDATGLAQARQGKASDYIVQDARTTGSEKGSKKYRYFR
jgi:hypothetical protein